MTRRLCLLAVLLALLPITPMQAAAPSPSEFLGIEIGSDRVLADYRQIASYFRMLDRESPRVELVSLGRTTLGEEMLMAVISSEENIAKLPRLKQIAAKLADPRGLGDAEVAALIDEGRSIVLVTCNIHSTEIASSQMAMEWAHALAVAEDPKTMARLDEAILLLVPSLNPDGQIMETEWYRRWLGTPFEGGRMPRLYHHYVGHDNNRDWFMLTQKETRNLTRAIYHEWFPQVFVDEHQMGANGPRMFIPPFSDPVDPDVHPLIWREINLIGSNMALRLEEAGKAGVIYGYGFDAYWLGGTRNTAWWKNITGLLLEVASARIASPVEVHATELRGGRKGLVEYGAQINHPNPWRGGVWTMRDIMDYERIASDALLEIAAERREDLLKNLVTRARSAVEMAQPREAYVIPYDQRDAPAARRLALLLADHGVEVFAANGGDFWIPLAQPYGRFVREMLEPQRYPEIRPTADGGILQPYDVATWTLPLMMGVEVRKARMPALVDGARLEAPIGRGAVLPEPRPASSGGAPWYAILPRSAENARVIQAALAAKGDVRISRRPERDLVQAPVPFESPAGTVWLEARAAEAARGVASSAGVELIAATGVPEEAIRLTSPRLAIYQPWQASMDEGWTRWLLDEYGFDAEPLDNRTIRAAAAAGGRSLRSRFDAIILPDIAPAIISTGKPHNAAPGWVDLPPEWSGGLGKEGAEAIQSFVAQGGTLIAFDSSSEWAIETLQLPVRNALGSLRPGEFSNPGSLLRVEVSTGHPITAGLPAELAIFHDDPVAFETSPPLAGAKRWVLAVYPEDERDLLLSGWISGAERLERKVAAVALTSGKGRVVLFGFRPQHRGQTHATFPMLFNALWWSVTPLE
ncbi:MAG: M14 metallopeptidase family protein [Thermoanaerobaculia bacterium]